MPLTHPEYFTILAPDGRAFRGAVQDWYPTAWQRRAGCGPTTAAVLLSYLARTHPALASLGPQGDPETTAGFLPYMEELWRYATPGPQGLKEAEHLTLACRSFALSRGCRLREAILPIPRAGQGARPTPAQCRSFLEDALGRDCPVAFLNYDEGDVTELDGWHWVPLVAVAPGDDVPCTVLDERPLLPADALSVHRSDQVSSFGSSLRRSLRSVPSGSTR